MTGAEIAQLVVAVVVVLGAIVGLVVLARSSAKAAQEPPKPKDEEAEPRAEDAADDGGAEAATEVARALLPQVLGAKGIVTVLHNEQFAVKGEPLAVDVEALQVGVHPAGQVVGLELQAILGDQRWPSLLPVTDVVTGVGATRDEAVKAAITTWVETTLPALRAAVSGTRRPDRDLRVGDRTFDVWLGPLQVVGDEAPRAALAAALAGSHPFGLLEPQLGPMLGTRTLHWVKLLGARDAAGGTRTECNFDSEPWFDGTNLLEGAPWPEAQGAVTWRCAAALRPRVAREA
jgi:hypothetical protein